jgi:hypothetical protein
MPVAAWLNILALSVAVVTKLTQEIDMNRLKRQQIHQALVNAVPRLAGPSQAHLRWTTKDEYICHAIDSADGAKYSECLILPSRPTKGATLAKAMIAKRLHPSISLDGWLEHSRGVNKEDLTWKNMQKHRHAWLKMLIKEFSK